MTELSIRPEEIREALEGIVASYDPQASRDEVGVVTDTGDGIARVEGLYSAMTNELLEFEGGLLGIALNLDVREIGCVILGDAQGIEEGQQVRRTGNVLSIPVGDGFLGRVVDPLGRPLDGKGDIESTERRELEVQAPNVMARQPVKEPMQTGIKAIDAMTAIGRGQRQLIIGDRQTGKTAVALDAIINQRDDWKTGDKKKHRQVRLRRDRPEGLDRRAGARTSLEEAGAHGVHDDRRRPGVVPGGVQVHRAVRRLRDRAALDVQRRARADRVRRPVEAGRRLPQHLAAAAPSRPVARPTRATSSTCTRGCSSAARSSPTTSAAAR